MDIVAIVTVVLQLIEQVVLPNISSASTVAKVIAILEQVLPIAIQTGEALVTPIKNIIDALKNSGPVTQDQLDQLDAFEAKIDADFDAAAAAATVQDK